MLTKRQNDLLTRTGPGTPLGDVMRRYWVPALLSEEIAGPDCPPVRVPILGEELLAFRDTNGRIGLIAEQCSHRGTSLFYGRNEECGATTAGITTWRARSWKRRPSLPRAGSRRRSSTPRTRPTR